jgi:hypothetical protein
MAKAARDLVRQRAQDRCEYCRLPDTVDPMPFHVDHVVARQHGAGDELENLAWTCGRCNAHKGTNLVSIDPHTRETVKLFHPRTQAWRDHFELRGAEIVGLTAEGRVTVALLQMNAARRVLLRQELIEQGVFELE